MTDLEFFELTKRVEKLEELLEKLHSNNEVSREAKRRMDERITLIERKVLDIETAFEQLEQAAIPLNQALMDIKTAWGMNKS